MLAAVEALSILGVEMLVSMLHGEVGSGTDPSPKGMDMGTCQSKISMGWVQEERPNRRRW